MERRHQDTLTNRLEEAHHAGCAHILWEELYLWYGVQKIAARTYRDLGERWESLTNGEAGKLMMVEGRGGMFIFGQDSAKLVDRNGDD